jgi:hypothetical protein
VGGDGGMTEKEFKLLHCEFGLGSRNDDIIIFILKQDIELYRTSKIVFYQKVSKTVL